MPAFLSEPIDASVWIGSKKTPRPDALHTAMHTAKPRQCAAYAKVTGVAASFLQKNPPTFLARSFLNPSRRPFTFWHIKTGRPHDQNRRTAFSFFNPECVI